MRNYYLIPFACLLLIFIVTNASPFDTSQYLPLGRSWAGDKKLPLPVGVSARYYYQDQAYVLSELWINDEPRETDDLDTIDVSNEIGEWNLKIDVWVLPFVNFFGLLGSIKGNTLVDFAIGEDMNIDYEGWMWGIGATIATGMGRFFSTVSTIYTDSNLDVTTSTVNAWILSPNIGVNFNDVWFIDRFALWGGAMYQRSEEKHEGDIGGVPLFGEIHYKVGLRQRESWNFQMGLNTEFTEHICLELDGGLGDRHQASASLMYRF
ncbi:hypothetical protein JXI42_10315 [bacterium]|nr:hypothetical protein [bacterium]